jgi:hypothetical protein
MAICASAKRSNSTLWLFVLLLEDATARYGRMMYAVQNVQHLGWWMVGHHIDSRIASLGVTDVNHSALCLKPILCCVED